MDSNGNFIAGSIPDAILSDSIYNYVFQNISLHKRSRLTYNFVAKRNDHGYIYSSYDTLANLYVKHNNKCFFT